MTDNQPRNTSAQAAVSTDAGGKYLAQLCKHFGHKVPVQLAGDRHGIILFPAGTCDLASNPEERLLTLRIDARTGAERDRLCSVIESHLARFAFRETLTLDWSR